MLYIYTNFFIGSVGDLVVDLQVVAAAGVVDVEDEAVENAQSLKEAREVMVKDLREVEVKAVRIGSNNVEGTFIRA